MASAQRTSSDSILCWPRSRIPPQSIPPSSSPSSSLKTLPLHPSPPAVLVLAIPDALGLAILTHLLGPADLPVRAALVRSPGSLPITLATHPNLTLLPAAIPDMPAAQLAAHVAGCAAVVSALAHETAWRGVPRAGIGMGGRDLCTGVARRVCEAVARVGPDVPVKYVMLGWVDDDVYPEADAASVLARVERGVVTALKACFPPWMDTATAARYLVEEVGAKDPFVEWVVVRTGVGRDGRVGAYVVGERRGLFAGGVHGDATTGWTTTRANVAHFVGELVARDGVWAEWRGRMPLVCDAK